MALQKSITLDNGIVCASAYHKVQDIGITYQKDIQAASILVHIWKDAQARTDGKAPVLVRSYTPTNESMDGGIYDITVAEVDNLIVKAYAFIKTLSDYEDAIDV